MSAYSVYSIKLSEINRAIGVNVDWQPLSRLDHTNRLWLATIAGEQVVLRMNACQNRAFGVSRTAEQRVLTIIERYKWSPKVLACNPSSGWCLMRFHGNSLEDRLDSGPLLTEERRWLDRGIIQAVRDMYDIKAGPETHYFELLKRYENHFSMDKTVIGKQNWQEPLKELSSVLPIFSGQQQSLVHHDLHPGNICIISKQKSPVIIDWEYAGIGNPWLDCAQLLKSRLLTTDQVEQLPLWQQTKPPISRRYLQCAFRINELLEQLWLLARDKLGGA